MLFVLLGIIVVLVVVWIPLAIISFKTKDLGATTCMLAVTIAIIINVMIIKVTENL
jgi:hypothetical protein